MRTLFLTLTLLLSGCAAFTTTPQAPPPPGSQAQEISRAQSFGLPKLGNITATTRGSPDDAQRAIAAKANQAGAVYYQIVMLDETTIPSFWYATAILYGAPSASTGAQQ
ncbi:biofilm stress and motility protein A [Pantoea sp. RIT-PI-b]|uniref:biofilm peroxide resistance protein BsmA n=1 Tax=Pantoea sp. RIT-PI-b TaxID=1681195 RepID=UPI000675E633|nr:biofilm peroxide resistance protein BsmA [Pantoea sp. RIT-PI-b]KNC14633.1 biofilm stress and motility protein A [Pantoea sp. RIT-PI-b]